MTSGTALRIPISKLDHPFGPANAPLILIEYGDYQCPSCGRAYSVIQHLQKTLKDDLRFVFRNFPLAVQHPFAMAAAQAAEAAGLQGKFWEMHDMLYENQDALDPEGLFEYASALRLDLEKFTRDMASPEVEERIAHDLYGGARSGVNGTPGFFINGFRYDGDWSFSALLTVLTALRKKAA